MCGIVGIAAVNPPERREWLAAGRDAMAHRGPDAIGELWTKCGRVGLAHRRLSILDLTEAGGQPMVHREGGLSIVFNGEIYNFRDLRSRLEALGHTFNTHSDTEVLLVSYLEWGFECLDYLEGMFAFALHDQKKEVLFLARDRAGEKPLFYHLSRGELRFASELKGLLADRSMPRRVDRRSLDCYLSFSFVPGDMCILDGYNKLPAAHAMVFNYHNGDSRVYRYWEIPTYEQPDRHLTDDELTIQLEHLLEASVKRQLVADVPVGLLLSGGVDSSLITALAARSGNPLRTFTVGFRETPAYDETRHARLIAEYFGSQHTVLEADLVGPEIIQVLARQYDEPMVDSSMIPTFLVTKEISAMCKVALGGDGGDELFGGYYSASRMAQLQGHISWLPLSLRKAISNTGQKLLPTGHRGRHFLGHIGVDATKDVPPFMPKFDQEERRSLLSSRESWPYIAEEIRAERIPRSRDAVQRVTRFDFVNYMAEDILVKVDRASMLNSLEVRSPFLDVRVVEFAYSRVPSRLKANAVERKIILRNLAKKILPPEFDKERKQGFGIPLAQWLRNGAWRIKFEEILLDRSATFDRVAVSKLFAGLDAGRPISEHLFGLALFESWRKEYQITL